MHPIFENFPDSGAFFEAFAPQITAQRNSMYSIIYAVVFTMYLVLLRVDNIHSLVIKVAVELIKYQNWFKGDFSNFTVFHSYVLSVGS